MKAAPRPLPTWLKWVCRLFGAFLILGSLYLSIIVGIALVGTFQIFLGPKGHSISDNQWLSVFGMFAGKLVGQILLLLFGIWLVRKAGGKNNGEPETTDVPPAPPTKTEVTTTSNFPASTRNRRWHSSNLLQAAPDANRLWQFDAKSGALNRESSSVAGQPVPARHVAKSWQSLWQPKLNIAWLPPENVFLRVIELPKSSMGETLSMVELQLEKTVAATRHADCLDTPSPGAGAGGESTNGHRGHCRAQGGGGISRQA